MLYCLFAVLSKRLSYSSRLALEQYNIQFYIQTTYGCFGEWLKNQLLTLTASLKRIASTD